MNTMNSTNPARIHDNYGFATKSRDEFVKEIKEIQADSAWDEEVPADTLKITHIQPIDSYMLSEKYGIDQDILADTADEEGTKLLLQEGNEINGTIQCLRDTGYYGLLQTAIGLSGSGIKRLWKRSRDLFVESMNEFLKSNGNSMKVYRSCGKVSGVFSQTYKVMEIPELFEISEEAFAKRLGDSSFESGELTHSLTSCGWALPDIKEKLMDSYHEAVNSINYNLDFTPSVKLVSSNTGSASAMLLPMLKSDNGRQFPLGRGVRIRHDNRNIGKYTTGCGMNDFKQQANEIFPRFMDSMEALKNMAQCDIEYTQNAFIAACNWAFGNNVPSKYASAALDSFMDITEGDPCSMHDIFIGICDIATEASKNGASLERRAAIDDALARFYGYRGDWGDFDISGTVAWNTSTK